MDDVIKLEKGKTYYRAVFFDRELLIPCIETFIYEGYEEKHGHLFINATGYVARMEGKSDLETSYISFAKGAVTSILDKEHLIHWLQEEHSPKLICREYEYVTI